MVSVVSQVIERYWIVECRKLKVWRPIAIRRTKREATDDMTFHKCHEEAWKWNFRVVLYKRTKVQNDRSYVLQNR